MDFITPQAAPTADGSYTLLSPVSGDTYHSVNGALTESVHVFIRNGFELCPAEEISVLEAGFGMGLNAWLTAKKAIETGRIVDYTAVELFPVDPSILCGQGFPDDAIFRAVHSAPWGVAARIDKLFTLTKIHGDLAGTVFDTKFDVVYFDMFAPDTVPHLWSEHIFAKILGAMNDGAALVTYSAKGDVKRALRSAGFEVRRLQGAPGKRHMLRALKSESGCPTAIKPETMDRQFKFSYEKYDTLAALPGADLELAQAAKKACGNAYVPYSNYCVGAAARLASGRVITGSNQESEVFPAGVCAERSMLFHHQAHYKDDPIEAIAIASLPDQVECYPCGICRQVINDSQNRQGSPIRVIMTGRDSATVIDSAEKLLPFLFRL